MPGHSIQIGTTGKTVQANITQLRKQQNLTCAELSRKLKTIGRDIPSLGIRRIEAGTRRIDVDDLTALAAALGVHPAALLVPNNWNIHVTSEGFQ